MSDYKSSENGYTGELRTKSLLSEDFWLLTRSVDLDSVDLIVQRKADSQSVVQKNRVKSPQLAYVQSKFVTTKQKEGFLSSTQAKIPCHYVEQPDGTDRKGFFALIHTTFPDRDHTHYFFSSREIMSHWELTSDKSCYYFSLCKSRNYIDFRNKKVSQIARDIELGISDLNNTIKQFTIIDYMDLNTNVRDLQEKCGKYIFTRVEGCPIVIYKSENGNAYPLELRKDVYQYSGYFEWGHGGTSARFLAYSLLVHFFGGEIPKRHEVTLIVERLISLLDKEKRHEIESEHILLALAHIAYNKDLNSIMSSNGSLKSLYTQAYNDYKKYL
ncbi:hypothetical protein [Vibrio campbellii]|uniref:hypothetical protein n=1 Tax=Vibrio campbellii TaxID=680 RepID=UPI0009A499E8|nr:hypothetical protein [Vibrio campbellii]OPH48013.1 hypothetical protein B4U81_24945 [Vibrio campbellii]